MGWVSWKKVRKHPLWLLLRSPSPPTVISDSTHGGQSLP